MPKIRGGHGSEKVKGRYQTPRAWNIKFTKKRTRQKKLKLKLLGKEEKKATPKLQGKDPKKGSFKVRNKRTFFLPEKKGRGSA